LAKEAATAINLEIPFNAYQELKPIKPTAIRMVHALEIPFNAYQELKQALIDTVGDNQTSKFLLMPIRN
jgi:hypothetical protein